MARRRRTPKRGTQCRFNPRRLKTVCRPLEPNRADGAVAGDYSIRDFENGMFIREEKDAFGKRVLVFRGVNVGTIDTNRWYEFSITESTTQPNEEEARRNSKTEFEIIPQQAEKK